MGTEGGPTALITGYRYLRLSMVAVLAMLFIAVLIEINHPSHAAKHVNNHDHILSSISAYYWTAVKPVFIATLVALGVGMIILKPEVEIEDVLLNVAGALAPIVAFVPTPLPDVCGANANGHCPLPRTATETIANNFPALAIAGLLALIMFLVLARFAPTGSTEAPPPSTTIKAIRVAGVALMALVLIVFVAWYRIDKEAFWRGAHLKAAFLMFLCIIAVVVLNALRKRAEIAGPGESSSFDRITRWSYLALAVVMVSAVVVCTGLKVTKVSFEQNVLVLEGIVLASYLAFWALQTVELWAAEPDLPPDKKVWGF